MSKSRVLKGQKYHKEHEELADDDFDFFHGDMEPFDDDAIAGMMHGLIDSSNHQQIIALELTKLIVEKASAGIDEEKVFSIFQRASKIVSENTPLKNMWERFNK